jgi:hypothetical protein
MAETHCKITSSFADLSLRQSVRKHVLLIYAQTPVGGHDTLPPHTRGVVSDSSGQRLQAHRTRHNTPRTTATPGRTLFPKRVWFQRRRQYHICSVKNAASSCTLHSYELASTSLAPCLPSSIVLGVVLLMMASRVPLSQPRKRVAKTARLATGRARHSSLVCLLPTLASPLLFLFGFFCFSVLMQGW